MSETQSLPVGWRLRPLGEVTEPKIDQGGPTAGEFVYVDISSIEGATKRIVDPKRLAASVAPSRARQRLRAGDVVVSMTRPNLNAVALVPPELDGAVGSTGFHVLRARGVEPRWLFYAVRSADFVAAMSGLVQGALYPAVRPKDVRAYSIAVPPPPEQRRIVAEIEKQFTRLDAGGEALRRLQAHIRRYRAALLKAAFDGGLVQSEAALAREQHRDFETGQQLLSRILAVRPDEWAEWVKRTGKKRAKYIAPEYEPKDDLPPLPEGWCWATWDQVGFSQNGRAFPSRDYGKVGVRLLRPGNLHVSGRVVWNEQNERRLPRQYAGQFPELLVGPDELVMNLTAQSLKDEFLGRVCMTGPDEAREPCLLNQRQARLAPILISRRFIFWLFKSRSFRRYVDGLNKGSLIQHMFTSQLARFALPLPPLAEQNRIVAVLEQRLSDIATLEQMVERGLARTRRLRPAILRAAFDGRLVNSQEPARANVA